MRRRGVWDPGRPSRLGTVTPPTGTCAQEPEQGTRATQGSAFRLIVVLLSTNHVCFKEQKLIGFVVEYLKENGKFSGKMTYKDRKNYGISDLQILQNRQPDKFCTADVEILPCFAAAILLMPGLREGTGSENRRP